MTIQALEHHQEREAKLLPVIGVICLCSVGIIAGSYFIGNFLF
ncbi:MAG: hypothetical protein ACI945_001602 [Pseudohongiellaceae bacterium]|jgi:hypothetical protein